MNSNVFDGVIFMDATQVASDSISIEEIIGLENLKLKLKLIQEIVNSDTLAKSYGLKPAKGLIFAGKPGCGKTYFGKLLAKQLQYNFIYVSASEFHSAIKGIGKSKVKKIFNFARNNTPCVLFIDEIDSVIKDREIIADADSGGVLQQFLAELDGQENNEGLLVVCSTNVLNSLDAAFKRSGRFDMIFNFDTPNLQQRIEAFKKKLEHVTHKSSSIDYRVLGEITESASYADIDAIIKIAKEKAFFEKTSIVNRHLISGVQTIQVGEASNANTIDKKSYNYLINHIAGHTIAYLYKIPLFVFAQTKIGHSIKCSPTHQSRIVSDIDDIVIQLISIYTAKESNFKKTGASTSLYTDKDIKHASQLLKKALLMLGVTNIDEDKFIILEQILHTQLTQFAKNIFKNYFNIYEEIKKHLITTGCITREELKIIIKQKIKKTPKEIFFEFKKMIEELLRNAKKGYTYLNTEEDDKDAVNDIQEK